MTDVKRDMKASLDLLYELQDEIILSSYTPAENQRKLDDEQTIEMKFLHGASGTVATDMFSLNEAVQQMMSSIFNLMNDQSPPIASLSVSFPTILLFLGPQH